AASEQERCGLEVAVDDQGTAVTGVAERPAARALDLHLIVERQPADLVFHADAVELHRRHLSVTDAGRAPHLVYDVADVEWAGDRARERTDAREGGDVATRARLQSGDGAVHAVRRRWIERHECRE